VGFATTQVLVNASEDFHVIMACRSVEKAEKAKAEIEAAGTKGSLSIVHLDVTDQKLINQAAEFVRTKFGKLDVLVNNAAVGNVDPDVKTRYQISMENNVIGPAMVAAAFRPLLLKSPKPYSLFISSGQGSLGKADLTPIPYGDAYRASKAALNMVALLEWQEFKSKGLKTFAVCPGFVVSNLRGLSEEARNPGGKAGDPEVSGRLILSIIEGKRDEDVGRFVQKDGLWPW
jgi:NAD(P)-dependent dehydrogenase (short-subunit alcohol dehydrogenase family)